MAVPSSMHILSCSQSEKLATFVKIFGVIHSLDVAHVLAPSETMPTTVALPFTFITNGPENF